MVHLCLTRGVIISDNMAYDRVVLITDWPNSYVNIKRAVFAQHQQTPGGHAEGRCMR